MDARPGVLIVVDLGCRTHGEADSLTTLARRFRPDIMYGFDIQVDDGELTVEGVPTRLTQAAAWDEDGTVTFIADHTATHLTAAGVDRVRAFDFSRWLQEHVSPEDHVIVKMDIEGSEYAVLRKMHADGTDELVDLLLLERHARWETDVTFTCPVEEWH